MTSSEYEQYNTYEEYVRAQPPVLGVLTGQYPARTMPIAMDPEEPEDEGSQ
jgi:hypothetical protein